MSLYGPLSDAFAEFNNLLRSQQTWKQEEGLRASTERRNDLILESRLQNQKFQQEIARSKHGLANLEYLGSREDAAAAADHRKGVLANMKANTNINRARQEATATHQANQDLLSTERFMETQEQNDLINKFKQSESDRADQTLRSTLDLQRENIQVLQNKNNLFEQQHTPQPISIKDIMSIRPDLWQNPEMHDMLAKTAGVRVTEDGSLIRIDNAQPVVMSKATFEKGLLRHVTGAMEAFDDQPFRVEQRIVDLEGGLEELEKERKEAKTGVGTKSEAYITAEINRTKGKLAVEESKLSVPSKIQYWQRKSKTLYDLAGITSDNTNVSNIYMEKGKIAEQRAIDLFDAKTKKELAAIKERTAAAGKRVTADKALAIRMDKAFKFGYEAVRKDYTPSNAILPSFPDQNKGIVYAEKLYERLSDMVLNEETGETAAPRSLKEAAELKNKVFKIHRQNHNTLYNRLVEFKGRPEKLALIRQASIDQLGYEVKKPYNQQIFRITNPKQEN